MQKIGQIRDFMNEQAEGLQLEIEEIKSNLIRQTNKAGDDNIGNATPSEKDIKDYKSKLEAQLLNSEQTIKI